MANEDINFVMPGNTGYTDAQYLARYGESKDVSAALYDQRLKDMIAKAAAENNTTFLGDIANTLKDPKVLSLLSMAVAPQLAGYLGGGIVGSTQAGAILGGTKAALTGENILKGTVTGGIGGAAGSYLNDTINNIAGLSPDTTAEAFNQIDINRLVDSGITDPNQLKAVLAQSGSDLSNEAVDRIINTALEGAVTNTTTNAITQTVNNTGTSNLLTTAAGEGGNTLTVTGSNLTNNAANNLLTGAATNLLTNTINTLPNTTVASTLPANQTVEIKGNKPTDNILTPTLTIPSVTSGNINVLPANQTVKVTAPKATTTGPKDLMSLTGLTAAQLAALSAGAGGLITNAITGPAQTSNTTSTDISTKDIASLIPGLLQSYLTNKDGGSYQGIFNTAADSIASAAAANQKNYQFSPIGITTRFGSATPTFDANGKLIGYNYNATGDIATQRDKLLQLSQQALPTTTDLGDITKNYIAQQQGLLAPQQQQDLATLQARLAATGRAGLATGATTGANNSVALAATNPELAAYYNSLAQQNAQLAANAPTYAQDLLNRQINTSGLLSGQANTLEGYAQQPMNIGTQLGQYITSGSTNAANAANAAAIESARLKSTGALGALGAQQLAQQQLINTSGGIITNAAGKVFDWATGMFK